MFLLQLKSQWDPLVFNSLVEKNRWRIVQKTWMEGKGGFSGGEHRRHHPPPYVFELNFFGSHLLILEDWKINGLTCSQCSQEHAGGL